MVRRLGGCGFFGAEFGAEVAVKRLCLERQIVEVNVEKMGTPKSRLCQRCPRGSGHTNAIETAAIQMFECHTSVLSEFEKCRFAGRISVAVEAERALQLADVAEQRGGLSAERPARTSGRAPARLMQVPLFMALTPLDLISAHRRNACTTNFLATTTMPVV